MVDRDILLIHAFVVVIGKELGNIIRVCLAHLTVHQVGMVAHGKNIYIGNITPTLLLVPGTSLVLPLRHQLQTMAQMSPPHHLSGIFCGNIFAPCVR